MKVRERERESIGRILKSESGGVYYNGNKVALPTVGRKSQLGSIKSYKPFFFFFGSLINKASFFLALLYLKLRKSSRFYLRQLIKVKVRVVASFFLFLFWVP